ncbi:MAG: 3-oxoacid CoA-transferase subunit A [Proteobacteria bacterium]|nr:3-oxoacid CoA-transferase subunit A [Pseudomonadota bacterium]
MKDKIYKSCSEAVADIKDGATVMVGGFIGRGVPSNLLIALRDKGVRDITLIRNDTAGSRTNPNDTNILFEAGLVKKVITCFAVFGSPKEVSALEAKVLEGVTELELSPQGTLAERIRAGAGGIGGFYTPVGVGTAAAEGKEVRVIDGREMVLETALHADFALVKAHRADRMGNLVYRKTARNFNPIMAAAARVTIAEAEILEEIGDIDPDHVMTPAIFVDRIVVVPKRGAR